jgi:hypothetical protein
MIDLAPTEQQHYQERAGIHRRLERYCAQFRAIGARFGILPRRLDCRGGASVVAAENAAKPKDILMSKAKSKRKTASNSDGKKTVGRKSQTAHIAAKLKPTTKSAAGRQPRTSSQQPGRVESKQARIIAMLRTPGGATIKAMVHATGWQQHSVRGFLAGVVRKRLGLNLISDAGDSGRVYRIDDHPVDAQTNQAA